MTRVHEFVVLVALATSWPIASTIAFVPQKSSSSRILPQQQHQQHSQGRSCSSTTTAIRSDLLEGLTDSIPNPFAKVFDAPPLASLEGRSSISPEESGEFQPTTAGLIQQAKRVLAADLGIQDASLLDDTNFRWIGPVVDKPLSKREYLAAGKFFDLRSAFPDLDYRAHDFRIDEEDESTVRVTCRVTGTLRGELRLRNEVVPPTGDKMICPPEAISITFDMETGKVTKLCTGFGLDRLVGNTAGTTGVMAAALIAGQDISDWEIYPPATCVARFFGRPVKQLPETKAFLAPFPETVMIQLAKGILAADMAADDPTLLADDFTFCTPYVGPIRKKEFLDKYAREEFSGVDPSFSYFRVDPYDPVRVWVDVKPSAPGLYEGAPQAMSFTFDDEGFCKRITSWAIMDPTIGNGGGLAGPEGFKYAVGDASPGLVTRPLPRSLGRLRKRALEPFTGIGVDVYSLPGGSASVPSASKPKPKPEIKEPLTPLERLSSLREQAMPELQARQAEEEKIIQEEKANAARRLKEAEQRKSAALEKERAMKLSKQFEKKANQAKTQPKKDTPSAKEDSKQAISSLLSAIPGATLNLAGPPKPKVEATSSQSKTAVQKKDAGSLAADIAKRKQAEAKKAADDQEKKRKEAEAQKMAALEAKRKQEAEAKKAAAMEAANKRKQELEAKKAAEEERIRKAKEEKERQEALAEKRRQEAEAKRKLAEEAVKAKQEAIQKAAVEREKQLEQKKAETDRKRREAEEARQMQLKAQQAEKEAAAEEKRLQEMQRAKAKEAAQAAIQAAKERRERQQAAVDAISNAASRATINLLGLGRGEGGDAELAQKKKGAEESASKATPGATISLFGLGGGKDNQKENKKSAVDSASKATPGATISLFGFGGQKDNQLQDAKNAAAEAKTLAQRKSKQRQEAMKSVSKASSGSTIGIFGFGGKSSSSGSQPVPKTAATPKKAPPGVPTLTKWRKNFDGTVTGLISGSKQFPNGEKITTSRIAKGNISTGEVVTTGSGSRYFLS